MSEINDIEELTEMTYPINITFIVKHQRQEPSRRAKYKDGTHHKGYFPKDSSTDINLIMCKGKIIIPLKLQSYVLHWYHTYLLHSGMDRREAMICQNF